MQKIASDRQAAVSMVESEFLQMTTLRPGEGIAGRVVIDLPKQTAPSVPLKLTVEVGEETHEFNFSVDAVKN